SSSRRGPGLGFILLSGSWCVLFFSLSGSKLPTYVLPAFPFLALAAGYAWERGTWQTSHVAKGIVAASFVFIWCGQNILVPWYAYYRGTSSRDAGLLSHCRDTSLPVYCYPRPCETMAFYASRDDLKCFRSKKTNELIVSLMDNRRSLLLLTHRHSL